MGAADGVPFEALRALGEGLAGRDTASRVAGVRRALALAPAYDEAALALSRLLVDAGSFDEARQAAARVPRGSPFARDARFLDGVALLGLGRDREADVLFAELVSQQASAAALGNRAMARLRQGPGASGASTLLRQAVEAEPASVDLPFDLGWALLVEGEAEAAAFWLKGAVRRDPGDAQGRLLLSWALSSERPRGGGGRAVARRRRARPGPRADAQARPVAPPGARAAVRAGSPPGPGARRRTPRPRAPTRRRASRSSPPATARGRSRSSRARLSSTPTPRARTSSSGGRTGRRGENEKALAELRMALWCRDDPALRREIADLLRSMGRAEEARRVLGEP